MTHISILITATRLP